MRLSDCAREVATLLPRGDLTARVRREHHRRIPFERSGRSVARTAVFVVPEGYAAFVEELPGANAQGATLDEAGKTSHRTWPANSLPVESVGLGVAGRAGERGP